MVQLPIKTFLKVEEGAAVDAARGTDGWAAARLQAQGETWIEATDGAGIGWAWDGAAWSAPAETVLTDAERAAPLVLRRTKFLLALDAALGLAPTDPLVEDYIASAIDASTTLDDAQKRKAQTLLASAAEFYRSDPDSPDLLDAIGAEIGLTPAAIDALFLQASGLK